MLFAKREPRTLAGLDRFRGQCPFSFFIAGRTHFATLRLCILHAFKHPHTIVTKLRWYASPVADSAARQTRRSRRSNAFNLHAESVKLVLSPCHVNSPSVHIQCLVHRLLFRSSVPCCGVVFSLKLYSEVRGHGTKSHLPVLFPNLGFGQLCCQYRKGQTFKSDIVMEGRS